MLSTEEDIYMYKDITLPLPTRTAHTNKQRSQPANPWNGPVAPQYRGMFGEVDLFVGKSFNQ